MSRSINLYARAKPMPDAAGRADYISNPDRQENLLAVAGEKSLAFWRQLGEDSQAAWRSAGGSRTHVSRRNRAGKATEEIVEKQACEAREIHVALPRSVLGMNTEEVERVADRLAQIFREKYGVDCLVAIHVSATDKNVHAHILFSERQRLRVPEIRIADRNAFLDEEGRRKRTKKEILDENGELRPGCRIVPKGEVLWERHFGEKETRYASEEWLREVKGDLAAWINEELDPDVLRTVFDENGPYLAQKHIGKGTPEEIAERLQHWNENVKRYNEIIDQGVIGRDEAMDNKNRIALSPDANEELDSILGDLLADQMEAIDPDDRETIDQMEELAEKACQAPRTGSGANEAEKRELRRLYREQALGWQRYRATESSMDRMMMKADLNKISAQIARQKRLLGYDLNSYDQLQLLREAQMEARQYRDARQEGRKRAVADRNSAWNSLDAARVIYRRATTEEYQRGGETRIRRLKYDPTDESMAFARANLDEARASYREAKQEVTNYRRAALLENEYRAFAAQVAADPVATSEDVDRARDRYLKAARMLQEADAATINGLRRELRDLQKSQDLRNEKRRQEQGVQKQENAKEYSR